MMQQNGLTVLLLVANDSFSINVFTEYSEEDDML